ncbi:MAG: hypothetical protein K0S58_447 [Nitrospira sp.]|nr:hypothetical protein [Nitrospira sp.]
MRLSNEWSVRATVGRPGGVREKGTARKIEGATAGQPVGRNQGAVLSARRGEERLVWGRASNRRSTQDEGSFSTAS